MTAEGTPKPSVLVVDDEPSIRFILQEYFTAAGWTVVCAASEDEAKVKLAAVGFDVAILDLRLSKRDAGDGGLALIRHLALTKARTRTVLLTGYGSEATRNEARDLGAAAVLDKPLRLAELKKVVNELLPARPAGPE
jgi:DNA-binding response OmpR family regulator